MTHTARRQPVRCAKSRKPLRQPGDFSWQSLCPLQFVSSCWNQQWVVTQFLRSETSKNRTQATHTSDSLWWNLQLSKCWKVFNSPLYYYWLVVWTPLKNISQLGWLFPIYGKIKHGNQTTNQLLWWNLQISLVKFSKPHFCCGFFRPVQLLRPPGRPPGLWERPKGHVFSTLGMGTTQLVMDGDGLWLFLTTWIGWKHGLSMTKYDKPYVDWVYHLW